LDWVRRPIMLRMLDQERGATAITVAISMVVLLGMAAVAIDLSLGFNERRQDQTSSDLAAVAGALSFGDNDAIVDQAMATARTNLDTAYSDTDWISLWIACTDPNRPAGFTPINHSTLGVIDCISVNPSFVRVRLPTQLIAASFGRVLGVDTLATSADTIVTLLDVGGGAGSLPFAIRGDATSGEICLDTGTGQISPPCGVNETGSFGNIGPPLFGNTFLNTSPACTDALHVHVDESIAMGIDHILWLFTQSQWDDTGWSESDAPHKFVVDAVTNMDECTDTGGDLAEAADGVPINGVFIDTGNNMRKETTLGLMTGTGYSDGFNARLTRSSNTRQIEGYDLDNVPLWVHLLEDADHGIAACDGSTIRSAADIDTKNLMMNACLVAYPDFVSPPPQLFSDSILTSPRLSTAPRIWHNNFGFGVNAWRPIKSFDVVYIHGLWFDDKDDTVFYPGDGIGDIDLKNFKDIEQVTAYDLLDSMVSAEVLSRLGGFINHTFDPTIYE